MGSESLTAMVAGDSSFMIKTLYTFKLNGVSLNIDTTHVALLLVSVFILVMAVIARIKINKVDASDTPGMFQNVIEIIVEMLGTMVDGIMGKNANKFVNYISTLFLFIIISNISGLFGLRPPTADYGVTLCLGLITFILVQFNGIKKNRIKHFTALFQPIWFLFPINLIGEFAVPLSLSLRLFGNVMSGTVLMGLIYDLLSPFTVAYPASCLREGNALCHSAPPDSDALPPPTSDCGKGMPCQNRQIPAPYSGQSSCRIPRRQSLRYCRLRRAGAYSQTRASSA